MSLFSCSNSALVGIKKARFIYDKWTLVHLAKAFSPLRNSLTFDNDARLWSLARNTCRKPLPYLLTYIPTFLPTWYLIYLLMMLISKQVLYCWLIDFTSELKSVHFKNIVARSSVRSKLWSFSIIHQLTLFWFNWCIIKNYHSCEWTEDRSTGFL